MPEARVEEDVVDLPVARAARREAERDLRGREAALPLRLAEPDRQTLGGPPLLAAAQLADHERARLAVLARVQHLHAQAGLLVAARALRDEAEDRLVLR